MILRITGIVIGTYLIAIAFLMWWWDYEPDVFEPKAVASVHASANGRELVTGYTTTYTVMYLAETLLNKRGGFISNDVFPPGLIMDNAPEWEFGVLTQLRDAARAFRIDFSRSQSQSQEDEHLSEAEGKFFFDNSSWAFPQTEDEYKDGIRLFGRYLERLADPAQTGAQFYARADNLQGWLQGVETRLGSLSQRLSASVGKRQLNLDLEGAGTEPEMAAPAEEDVKTPWLKIDNVFFEARGQTWALLHLLKAMEHDFADILDKKNARVSLNQIIRELEPTQEMVWSPMILNGDGLGFLANHSLVMASYVSRVNAAIIDLRRLLAQG
ncbi:MAG: DUF2333 family protein [Pseudomonadota bacterium]